jgi:steroid delta-isomerase-like uncharacterized protein
MRAGGPYRDAVVMTEQNIALVKRFVVEYQTNHDESVLDELVAEEFVDRSPLPGVPPTREGVRGLFAGFHAAFSPFAAQIHDQVADGDKVVTRKTFHGRHVGDFMGIPATGRQVSIDVIDIVRIADGRIVEHWNVVDQLGLLRQLGALPG